MSAAARGRVLMVSQYLHMGGLERMVLSLSSELAREGAWKPSVFVFDALPGAAPENDLAPEFERAGVPVVKVLKGPGFSWSVVRRLRRELLSGGYSVVHTHDLGALIYGACAVVLSGGRARLVHTQHSFVHLARKRAYALYERLFTAVAAAVAVVSEDTRRRYLELGVPASKVVVVPNGVAFAEPVGEEPGARARAREALLESLAPEARAALAPLAGARWILYMARLHRVKGQRRALDLWARASPEARAGAALVFVGPESEAGELSRLRDGLAGAPDAARVVYAGAARAPEAWLRAADVALSCSEFEGLPLGPIEAAGAGLPLVVSDIAGHDAVRPFAAVFPLEDAAAGARALEAALSEAARGGAALQEKRRAAAALVRERYALPAMARAYSKLYAGEAAS